MSEQGVEQTFNGEALEHVFMPTAGQARGTVIIVPTVMGITDLERGFARGLNERGLHVFIADLFGKQFRDAPRDTMFGEMGRLKGDRPSLRNRMLAVLESARAQEGVDATRIAAIGYCFGGLCVLDLARSGAGIVGVASLHGLFDPPGLDPQPIKAKVIAYHGWDDPMVPPEVVKGLARELTDAGADWQIHAYGHTGHGFTNPNASAIGIAGVDYNRTAAHRSWTALGNFLDELFPA